MRLHAVCNPTVNQTKNFIAPKLLFTLTIGKIVRFMEHAVI